MFISKSVVKHHSVQNSLSVNLPTKTVGTVILALQHYPMLCTFLWPSDMNVCLAQGYICLYLPKCTCWGCMPLYLHECPKSLLLESFLVKSADKRDIFFISSEDFTVFQQAFISWRTISKKFVFKKKIVTF